MVCKARALLLAGAAATTLASASHGFAADRLELNKNAPLTSGYYLKQCKEITTAPSYRSGICQGEIQALYFLGFTNGLSADNRFCPPENATIEHAVQITVHYIEQTEYFALPLQFNAIAALKKAWPCASVKP